MFCENLEKCFLKSICDLCVSGGDEKDGPGCDTMKAFGPTTLNIMAHFLSQSLKFQPNYSLPKFFLFLLKKRMDISSGL